MHVDWHEHGDIQVIAYLDDASRKILAAGEFDSANIENGIRILGKAVNEVEFYGPIRALLSDNGSEFSSHWKHKDGFDTLDEFIGWYNDKRPHASLDFEL